MLLIEEGRALMQETPRWLLRFDGAKSFVDLGKRAEHKPLKALTMEAWIFPTRQLEWAGIVSRIFDTGATESGYLLGLDGKSGIYCGIRTAAGPAQNFYHSTGPDTLTLNAWHHVAATYDGKQLVIYIDGQAKKTVELQGDIDYDPDNSLTIGAYRDDNEFYGFPGLIGEVRLWSVARTAEELRGSQNVLLRGDEKGLAGYWRLDEGSGTSAADRSPTGAIGTISSATWEKGSFPAQQAAAEWIGNALAELPIADGASNHYFVDQQLVIGSSGYVTAFRIVARRANPLELVIYRRSGNGFAMVGKSAVVGVPSPGQHEFVLASPIAVQRGDLVGWHDLQNGTIAMTINGANASPHLRDRVAFTGDVSGTAFTQSSNRVYSIQVRVESGLRSEQGLSGPPPGRKNVLWFDGKDDYVSFPAMNLDCSQGITIEAMVRWSSFMHWSRIIDFGNGAGADNIVFANVGGSKDLAGVIIQNGQAYNNTSPGALTADTWLHVAVAIDASGQTTLYRDGRAILTGKGQLPRGVLRTLNYTGKSNWGSDGFFHGQMTELRIWGVARSEAEIAANQRRVLSGDEPGLLAYWPTDEGTGTTILDRTGRGLHGTLHGTTWQQVTDLVYEAPPRRPGSGVDKPGSTGASGGDTATLTSALERARGEEGQLAGMLRYNEAVLADSPIGYWKLNERSGNVANDISGNKRHGTYHGGVTLANKGAFAEGDAVVFDGKTGYVEITGATWGGGKEITIEAWVKTDQQTADFQAVVSALGQEFVHLQLHSAGNIGVYTDVGYTLLPILTQAPLGVWRHLALVAGGGNVKLYVDGELTSSVPASFSIVRPTNTLRIGGGYAGGRFFSGAIDEVAIYSYALPADRIKERVRIVRQINEIAQRAESPRQQRSFLRLDGKGYVEVKDPFENTKAFTISLWARPTVLDEGGWHGLLGKQGDAYRKPSLWVSPNKAGLHYDSFGTNGQRFAETLENFFEKNKWVHLTWVKRGDKYEFYRDGKLFAERPAPAEIYRADTSYWIGRVDNFFIGDLAEVRFWNVALHPAEVAAERSRVPRGDDLRLAYYWPLNEGEGTVAFDRTGQDDGKIVSAAWKREQTPFALAPDYGDVAILGAPPPARHMEPQKKEYFKITTVEQLREQLQHAITLELSTIPVYLYAAYSIKDPTSRASALILGVAFEEMLHMLLACNLMNAIGGSPKMTGPFAPVYPTFIPYHATGGPFIQLQRASRDLMANTFMQIEQPGVGRPLDEMEHGEEFETIGQFYEAIADGFRYCDEHHRLFIGDMARQQKAAYFGGGGGRIVTVTDLDSALKAIGMIVEQGEGTSGAYQGYGSDALEGPPPVGSFGQDRRSRELAHYFKFAAMATGEVEIPETWPMETNFRTSHFGLGEDKKWARDLSDLCNACYVYMLRTMEHALNRPASDGGFFSSSFPLMRSVVTPLGRLLAQTPLRRNNVIDDMQFDPSASEKIRPILVTAGPSFEYIEWSYEKIVETCSALMEPGVCPDDEETYDGYKKVFLETLARVLTGLEQVERIHEGER